MFCTNCGYKLKEDSLFCENCGKKIDSTQFTYNRNNYSMYDVFDYSNCSAKKARDTLRNITNSLTNLMYKNKPDILAAQNNSAPRIIYKYIITDKSIILEDVEYTYDQIKVISPAGNTEVIIGTIILVINQIKYPLYSPREDKIRLFYSLIKANSHIQLHSPRQRLQYAYTMYFYIIMVRNYLDQQQTTLWSENDVFEELWTDYKKEMVAKEGSINDYQKNLLNNYNEICKKLNEYFINENPISNAGYNRQPQTIAKIIDMMTDDDTDINAVITRYNQKIEDEKRRFEENLHKEAYYEEESGNSGGGFLSRTASTAIGTAIGNRITNGRKNGKRDLLGSARCVKGKAKHHTKGISSGHIISYGTMDCSDCPIRDDCTRW